MSIGVLFSLTPKGQLAILDFDSEEHLKKKTRVLYDHVCDSS